MSKQKIKATQVPQILGGCFETNFISVFHFSI